MSSTPEERKDHCITEHKFPSNFRFGKTERILKKTEEAMITDQEEKSSSTNKFKEFHFGHRRTQVFKSKLNSKTNPMNTMRSDLMETLPEI